MYLFILSTQYTEFMSIKTGRWNGQLHLCIFKYVENSIYFSQKNNLQH